MVATEATPAHNPGKRALDDPSSGQRHKPWRKEVIPVHFGPHRDQQAALGSLQTPDELNGPAQVQLEPGDQLATVVAIAPEPLDLGKALLEWLQ